MSTARVNSLFHCLTTPPSDLVHIIKTKPVVRPVISFPSLSVCDLIQGRRINIPLFTKYYVRARAPHLHARTSNAHKHTFPIHTYVYVYKYNVRLCVYVYILMYMLLSFCPLGSSKEITLEANNETIFIEWKALSFFCTIVARYDICCLHVHTYTHTYVCVRTFVFCVCVCVCVCVCHST